MTKKEAASQVREAKARLGLTWAQLAWAVGRPIAWTTAALLGQHPMTEEQASAAASLLDECHQFPARCQPRARPGRRPGGRDAQREVPAVPVVRWPAGLRGFLAA